VRQELELVHERRFRSGALVLRDAVSHCSVREPVAELR
jgi:hypothetical protein